MRKGEGEGRKGGGRKGEIEGRKGGRREKGRGKREKRGKEKGERVEEKGEREPCTRLLIDHIYTNQPGKITECFVPEVALGDHYPDNASNCLPVELRKLSYTVK